MSLFDKKKNKSRNRYEDDSRYPENDGWEYDEYDDDDDLRVESNDWEETHLVRKSDQEKIRRAARRADRRNRNAGSSRGEYTEPESRRGHSGRESRDRYAGPESRRGYRDQEPYGRYTEQDPYGDYSREQAQRDELESIRRAARRDDGRKKRKKKRRRRHPFRKFLLILLIIIAALAGLAHLAYSRFNRVDQVADAEADDVAEQAGVSLYSESGVMNVLLIGQDARSGQTQTRSDTMIICSLNIKTGKITLVSLMRDLYVPITNYGSNRLNAAYAYGGMATLDETIQNNFGIDIDGNAVVDFEGFLGAITAVGNIEVELTAEEAEYLNTHQGYGSADDQSSGEAWNLTEGVNSLTPSQALAYSRIRYLGNSDFDRVDRQKKVIQAVFAKVRSNPIKMIQVFTQAAPYITTDMTDLQLSRAIFYALRCGTDMNTYTIPEDGMYTAQTIDGMSVLVPDISACAEKLKEDLYG